MSQQIDKALVACRFGRRAAGYEAATPVQAAMAEDLHEGARAAFAGRAPRRILELGCGSGRLTRLLAASWPDARIVSLDIAADMVALARRQCPGVCFEVADAEDYLQRCDQRFDLLISNATLQWFQNPEVSLPRCRELLAPGGLAALTTFGCDTFRELREAFEWAYAELGQPPRRHTGEFPDAAFWRRLLPGAVVTESHVVQHFADVRAFLRSVQEAGATNAFTRSAAMRRDVLRRMQALYAARFAAPGGAGVCGTYHVVQVVMAGPPL